MFTTFTCAFLALLAAGRPVSLAEPALRFPDRFHRLSRDIVTPHIPWARPSAGRKLRAIVIGPRWGQRETVELMERLDIECQPVMLQDNTSLYCEGRHWGHEQVPSIWKDAVLKDITDALASACDVVVLGQVAARQFPPELVEALKAKVRGGTGLVYFWPDHAPHAGLLNALREGLGDGPAVGLPEDAALSPTGAEALAPKSAEAADADFLAEGSPKPLPATVRFLLTGVPVEVLPGFGPRARLLDAAQQIAVRDFGKGRAVFVSYRSPGALLTPDDDVDLHYEYYHSFVIKAIRLAARDEPRILFETFPRVLTESPLALTLRNSGPPAEVSLTLSIRSPEPLHRLPACPAASPGVHQTATALVPLYREQKSLRVPTGVVPAEFALPDLPGGQCFLDVEIGTDAGKVNWATACLDVKPGWSITDCRAAPQAIDTQRPPPYAIQVRTSFSGPAPGSAAIQIAVLDNHDRLLALRQELVTAGSTAQEMAIEVTDIRSTLVRVRAEIQVARRTCGIRVAYITATNRPWDDFTLFAWGGVGRGYVGRQCARLLAQLGVDAFRGGSSIETLQVADVRCIADLCRFNSAVENRMLQPCYNDPEFRKELRASIRNAVERYGPFDPFGFLCGDEWGYMQTNTAHDACWCPHCLTSLRRTLQDRYRTVESLNAQWGTQYASFDTVLPVTIEELTKRVKEKGDGNYSPLIDQWVHNFDTFGDIFRFCTEALQEADGRRGMGYTTPLWNWWYRGYNWPEIVPHCRFASPYGPWGDITHSEAARSFAKPGTVLSSHYGSYVTPELHDEDHFRMVPYTILLNGFANAFWYTTWGNEGGISPSLDPYPCLRRSSEEIARIKQGLGTLILGAKRQHDGIAIHYSMPSYIFSFLVSGPHVAWRMNALIGALEDLGVQFDLVSSRQIGQGALDSYKVLFLPVSQCIGETEAAQMKRFVEKGGVLIADVKPGIADEHGKVGAQKTIPGLFGMKWADPLAPEVKRKVLFSGAYRGQSFSGKTPSEIGVDAGFALDGAEGLLRAGDTPVLIHRPSGQGTAICLNFPIYSQTDDLRNVLRVLLSAHGVASRARVQRFEEASSPGTWVPGFESSRFADGGAEYCGFTRHRTSAEVDSRAGRVDVVFNEPRHVHDLRTGEYLGCRQEVSADVTTSHARLLAALPYRVTGLRITLNRPQVDPGDIVQGAVEVLVDGAKAGRHVIHVSVERPDGQRVRYLTFPREAREGKAEFQIPLGRNEPTGRWTVFCTDVATQTRQQATFEVQAAP